MVKVALREGPGDGKVVQAYGPQVTWRACLYERTGDHTRIHDEDLRIYQHRPDCCQPYGRGSDDICE